MSNLTSFDLAPGHSWDTLKPTSWEDKLLGRPLYAFAAFAGVGAVWASVYLSVL